MAIFVNDTFTAPDGTTLAAHTGETGATWTAVPGGYTITGAISNNRLVASATVGAQASGTPGSADYHTTGRLRWWSATGGQWFGVMARINAGTFYIFYANASTVQLNRSFAAALGSSVNFTFSPTDDYDLTIECIGTTLKGYVQRVSDSQWMTSSSTWQVAQTNCVSATDANITGAGAAGFLAYPSTEPTVGGAFDQVSATDGALGGSGATGYTLTGPASGFVNVASTAFTITATGGAFDGTEVFTPHSTGTGTFSPSSITTTNGATTATFTYTPTTTAGSPHTVSTTNNKSFTDPAGVAYTVNPTPVSVLVNNANIIWPPGGWFVNGSTSSQTAAAGNLAILGFTGSTYVKVTVDVSSQVAASVGAGAYPTLRATLDYGPPVDFTLTSSSGQIALFTGLTTGAHTLRLFVLHTDQGYAADAWTTPANVVKITGFELDGNGSTVAPTALSGRMLWFGDSTGEAAFNLNFALDSHALEVASSFGCELAMACYSGVGYTVAGQRNVPPLFTVGDATNTSYDKMWAGRARAFAGVTHVGVSHGINGTPTSAVVAAFLTALRAKLDAGAKVFVTVPIAGSGRTGITAGFAAYQLATPDANCYFVDLGTAAQDGYGFGNAGYLLHDSLHPNNTGQQRWGAALARGIQLATGGGGGVASKSGQRRRGR